MPATVKKKLEYDKSKENGQEKEVFFFISGKSGTPLLVIWSISGLQNVHLAQFCYLGILHIGLLLTLISNLLHYEDIAETSIEAISDAHILCSRSINILEI